jgi:hypothetical protein
MSETEKIKEIYKKNIFLPSQNNICGIVTKDNAAYKCSNDKFCNHGDEKLGICENTGCFPYNTNNIDIDFRKFDGSGVLRNRMTNICERKISTDGKCGLDNNSTKCPNGQCCSMKGTCGFDKESCIYISPYYSDNIIGKVNRNYYSNYNDVKNFQYEFIKQLGNKYIGNNNFELSTNGKCGLDLDKEKIFKCSDNQYCDEHDKCSVNYKNYNNNNKLNSNIILQDLDLNLIHGNKFNEEYDKWENRKEKIQSIRDKYITNNNFEISTDGRCGIDLENEKIFRCSDKQYCNQYNKCSVDYNNYKQYDFDNNSLKDINSNAIYNNHERKLKDLSSNLIHGDKFIKQYNNFINPLDCNNTKILDSFKTFFNNKTGDLFKIADIVKINKVNYKTCDIKYNFEGKYSGQNSRRITFEYKPDIGYVCTNIGGKMSGLTTLPLDSNAKVSDEMADLTTNVRDETTVLATQNPNKPYYLLPFVIICLLIVGCIILIFYINIVIKNISK